jgi:hypothetical protein
MLGLVTARLVMPLQKAFSGNPGSCITSPLQRGKGAPVGKRNTLLKRGRCIFEGQIHEGDCMSNSRFISVRLVIVNGGRELGFLLQAVATCF